jgi:glucosamine-6-phosphate deaminase
MEIVISETRQILGKKAAQLGAGIIRKAIHSRGRANILLATGASQFEMLKELTNEDIDWSKVCAFHLDEYIGIPETHHASFRKYLKERFADVVDPSEFIYINGNADLKEEFVRLANLIIKHPIDVAFVGIGENSHLAFNDPPADFEINEPYIVVTLNEECRLQQMGEGWFPSVSDVPEKAISMSIKQIMKSKAIICSVPDLRKAGAVKKTLEGSVGPSIPASILRRHKKAWLFLDKDSSSLLSQPYQYS